MKYVRKVTIIVVSIVNLIIVNVHKTIIPGSELSEYLVFEIFLGKKTIPMIVNTTTYPIMNVNLKDFTLYYLLMFS